MNLPWVSRRAYDVAREETQQLRHRIAVMVDRAQLDLAISEIEWLRGRNEALTDAFTRIQRHQAGMYEVPRPARPVMEPMPQEITEYLEGFSNASMRKSHRDTLLRRHARGESWQAITEEVFGPSDEESEGE